MAITSSRLLRASRQFRRYYEQQFAPLLARERLSMRELYVVLFLTNNPDRDTARDVTELRGIPKSQVSAAVELLAGRGLLRRLRDAGDRRVVRLALTEAGRELGLKAREIQTACCLEMLSPLTAEESARFLALLEKVLEGAENHMREGAQS